jgi:hypothetical protein
MISGDLRDGAPAAIDYGGGLAGALTQQPRALSGFARGPVSPLRLPAP